MVVDQNVQGDDQGRQQGDGEEERGEGVGGEPPRPEEKDQAGDCPGSSAGRRSESRCPGPGRGPGRRGREPGGGRGGACEIQISPPFKGRMAGLSI